MSRGLSWGLSFHVKRFEFSVVCFNILILWPFGAHRYEMFFFKCRDFNSLATRAYNRYFFRWVLMRKRKKPVTFGVWYFMYMRIFLYFKLAVINCRHLAVDEINWRHLVQFWSQSLVCFEWRKGITKSFAAL